MNISQISFYTFIYACVFAIAYAITFVATPPIKSMAYHFGWLDVPGKRKIHHKAIPRLGGIAIFLGFLFAVHYAMLLRLFTPIKFDLSNFIGVLVGATIICIVGTMDDIYTLSPWVKLFWQIVAALFAISLGIGIHFISNPFGGIISISPILSAFLTLFWIVGITNALNLIDGLDGLAAGVAFISSVTLFFVALRTHQIESAFIMLALAGASLAFLRFNFYPAAIFLGDSGSLLLGYILATSSIVGVLKSSLVVALVIPVLILGIPIYDTLTSIIRRLIKKQNIFSADDRHLHHRLLTEGLDQRESVWAIYLTCIVLSSMALIIAWVNAFQAIFIFAFSIFLALGFFSYIKKRLRLHKGISL